MTSSTLTALITGGTSGIGRAAANSSPSLAFMCWLWGAARTTGRRQSGKFVQQAAKPISLPPISEDGKKRQRSDRKSLDHGG